MKKQSKLLIYICLLNIIILTGCTFKPENDLQEYQNWLYTTNDNSFRSELTNYISEFQSILIEIQNNNNNQYIMGRIDGFLGKEQYMINNVLNKESMDQETFEKIINPQLSKPLVYLVSNIHLYLIELKKKGWENVNKVDLKELIALLRTFNNGGSDIFTDKEKSQVILLATIKVNRIIQSKIATT